MTTLTKQEIKPTWTAEKTHQAIARAWVNQYSAMMAVICKHAPQAIEEFESIMRANKVEYFKSLNVKTPSELVKAMAEFEANAFGSKVEIWGDDKSATMNYSFCGIYDAMQKYGKMSQEQMEKAGTQHAQCVEKLGKEFGFNTKVEMGKELCTVTFNK